MKGRMILGAAIVVLGGLAWFWLRPSASTGAEPKTVTVKSGDIVAKVSAPGQIMPQRQSTLYTKTGGSVREIMVQPGQAVQSGQLLLRLDSAGLEAQIAAQETQNKNLQTNLLGSTSPDQLLAQQGVAQAQLALDQARLQFSRARADYQLGAIPRQQVDLAQTAFEQAQLNLQGARSRVAQAQQLRLGNRAQLETAQAQLQALKQQLAATLIRSPLSGTLTDLPVAVGQAVAADTALATVSDLFSWVAQSRVAETDLPGLHLGMAVKVSVDALQLDQGLPGKVIAIGQTKKFKDPVYYYQVDSLLQVGDTKPTPGLSATTDFITKQVKGVPILPLNALQTIKGKTVVELKTAQHPMVEVQTGLDDGSNVAILAGLKPGDVVVVPTPPGSAQSAPGGLGKVIGF